MTSRKINIARRPCLPRFIATFSGLVLAGCAVGPDFKAPAGPDGASYSDKPLRDPKAPTNTIAGGTQHFLTGKDVVFDWWKAFQCPQLDALVEKSLANNPTIPAALAALRQTRELTRAQQGFFWPTIGGGYNAVRQQAAGNVANSSAPGFQSNGRDIAPLQSNSPPFNSSLTWTMQTAQLTVGYTLDVFGGNRRQVESLDAQAEMQRFELEAAYITLSSNVVGAAVQEASLRGQIAATKQIIDVNKKMVAVVRKQVAEGYADRLDLAAQIAQLAQVEATLPPLVKQLDQLSQLHLPRELPVSLPSDIIELRPDVRAAEENLRSANAQVGAALANRLPQFTINGGLGGTSQVFYEMFNPGGPFWTMTGNVGQTLFDGGTLLHRHRAAKEAFLLAAAQYKSTVITAFQNVADSLHALEHDGDALKTALLAEHEAKVTLDLTTHQYENGYANYLGLLNAEQSYQQALMNLVQVQANRFADTAALFQALGGGSYFSSMSID
jgi:outer membrane protein TolC